MSAYGKYQNAYKRASVNTMDQNKLIVMLYDGAIKNITFGVEQMRLGNVEKTHTHLVCLLYTSPSPRDLSTSRMPSSA